MKPKVFQYIVLSLLLFFWFFVKFGGTSSIVNK